MEQFITRFGTPREVHTDQRREFEAELFQDVCKLLGVHKTRTTPILPPVGWYGGKVESYCSQAEATQTLEIERKLPTLVESEVLLQTTPNYKACKNSYY